MGTRFFLCASITVLACACSSGSVSGAGTGAVGGTGGVGGTSGSGASGGVGGSGGVGATGVDAGEIDSGGVDAAVGSDAAVAMDAAVGMDAATGGNDCATGGYLICEDFESTATSATPNGWNRSGNAAVADDQAAHGTHSLRIEAADNGARRITTDAAVLGSGHWGRIYYKVQIPVPTAFVHSTMVVLQGVGPADGYNGEYRVVDTVKQAGDASARHQFLYNVEPDGAPPEFGTGSPYNWTFDDAWHCAEWHIDNPTQSYEFYIDGMKVDSITKNNGNGNYTGTDIPPVFTQLKVGWNNYQSAPPGFVAWIDDVALDSTRVGCIP